MVIFIIIYATRSHDWQCQNLLINRAAKEWNIAEQQPLAKHRLKLLRKRLLKDPELFSQNSAFMTGLLDKGYATRVPEGLRDRNDGKVWYPLCHSVVHSQKPVKVRIVFHCAAMYPGTSLNSQVLQGPGLTNTVLCYKGKFQWKVAKNSKILKDTKLEWIVREFSKPLLLWQTWNNDLVGEIQLENLRRFLCSISTFWSASLKFLKSNLSF